MNDSLSYSGSGINIDDSDALKRQMKGAVDKGDPRVLNSMGAFGSLVDGRFEGYAHPVLVLKTEEPGSKQKLAFQYGYVASIAYDLANHLIDDIIVMGADPMYAQDCIVCGKLESDTVRIFVENLSAAFREQGCILTGGETSIQPGVVAEGEYILSASAIGVVDKDSIIDGANIAEGDVVIAVASNGLHTNGYTLVRKLFDLKPDLKNRGMGGGSFLDAIMQPHKCYYQACKGFFGRSILKGIAHITGGGIQDNLVRILPKGVDAIIDLSTIKIPEVFKVIREEGNVESGEMLRTFNTGVGLCTVTAPENRTEVIDHFNKMDCGCYEIGRVTRGAGGVRFENELTW